MIGRGERYPLVRHVTEDEIGRQPAACFGLGDVPHDGARLARPTMQSTHNPGWRGIRGAHAAYPWATVFNACGVLIDHTRSAHAKACESRGRMQSNRPIHSNRELHTEPFHGRFPNAHRSEIHSRCHLRTRDKQCSVTPNRCATRERPARSQPETGTLRRGVSDEIARTPATIYRWPRREFA